MWTLRSGRRSRLSNTIKQQAAYDDRSAAGITDAAISGWKKGGLRYAKLREAVPEFPAPERVLGFFFVVQRGGGRLRLFNPFTPLQREYVVAVTEEKVVVLDLRRPGVFRASVASEIARAPRRNAGAEWREGRLILQGQSFSPIAFHEEDAEEMAGLLGYRRRRLYPQPRCGGDSSGAS